VRSQPEHVHLLLSERFTRRWYPLERPRVPAVHRGEDDNGISLSDRFEVFEAEIGKGRSEPGARGKEASRTIDVSIWCFDLVDRSCQPPLD